MVDNLDHIDQLEPLLPREAQAEPLLEKAYDLIRSAERLAGQCQGSAKGALVGLLRAMNSYYSNKIEGEHTRPVEITAAMTQDFSADPDKARLQRLAVAHITTEAWLYGKPKSTAEIYTLEGLCDIHGHLFDQLPADDRMVLMRNAANEDTETLAAIPGQLRTRDVAVRRHQAPAHDAIARMIARWGTVYGGVRRGELQLLAAAAAHHRLLWIHPFLDGNGRAARLQSLAVLQSLDLTQGLWSPLRGLARRAAEYGEKLSNADMPRMGDLDGRGQRSERMLVEWIDFFLDVCLDQVQFMTSMLDLPQLQNRIAALLAYEAQVANSGLRMEAQLPLHYLFTQGEMARGDFARMTGLGERTATTLIAKLLSAGLLVSDSPKGKVRFGVPLWSLRFLFPALWPEAEADTAAAR